MNHKKVPEIFINKNTVEYMNIGDIRFVPAQRNFLVDEKNRLWVRKTADSYKQEEPIGNEDSGTRILSMLMSPIKIQKIEGGFKAFLYEFNKMRKERLSTCQYKEICAEGEKMCHCDAVFENILLSKVPASEFNRKDFLPVIDFDEEGAVETNTKEDYEKVLEELTEEEIKNSSSTRLRRLLNFSIKTEKYSCSERIKKELDSRKR